MVFGKVVKSKAKKKRKNKPLTNDTKLVSSLQDDFLHNSCL